MLSKLLTDELETFYWIGFILADGWVTSRIDAKGNQLNHLGISIQNKDKIHLERFLNYIDAPLTRIRTRNRDANFKKGAEDVSVCITDHVAVPILKEKFDINNDKTNIPPNMIKYKFAPDQTISLIIGFIDGYGSIAMRSKRRPHISIQTSKNWIDNLNVINSEIHTFCGEVVRNNVCINRRGHASLSLCKCSVISYLKQFIIDNKLPVLERKWDRINSSELIN